VAAGNFAAWFAFVGYVLVRSKPKRRRWWHPLRLLLMLGVGIVGAAAGQVLAYALGADLHSPWPGFAALIGFAAGLPVPVLLARRRAPEPASTPEELPESTPV
jgi:membrane associated rhomboid family serine protease